MVQGMMAITTDRECDVTPGYEEYRVVTMSMSAILTLAVALPVVALPVVAFRYSNFF